MPLLFQTDKIILVPEAPNDFTGHLVGVLNILDGKTILINDYKDEYKERISSILKSYHFNIETLSYNPYANKNYQSAKSIYINYLRTVDHLFVPVFNQKEDELALVNLSQCYPKVDLIPIPCNELAKEGGLLHCVSCDAKL